MKSFVVRSVRKRPNLRHLCEPLGGTEGLIETVWDLRSRRNVCDEEQTRIPEESEF